MLMPRETPLSTIHLETMLTAKRAGATILFLAPGFYHGAESVEDLVDFVVGRALDQLGVDNALDQALGDMTLALSSQGQEGRRDGGDRHPAAGRRAERCSTGSRPSTT